MVLRLTGAAVNWLQVIKGAFSGLVVKVGLLIATCHLGSGSSPIVLIMVSFILHIFRCAYLSHTALHTLFSVAFSAHWLCLSPDRMSSLCVKPYQQKVKSSIWRGSLQTVPWCIWEGNCRSGDSPSAWSLIVCDRCEHHQIGNDLWMFGIVHIPAVWEKTILFPLFFLQLPLDTESFPFLHLLHHCIGFCPVLLHSWLHPHLQWLHFTVGEVIFGLERGFLSILWKAFEACEIEMYLIPCWKRQQAG